MEKQYKFVEPVWADRDGGERVEVETGTTFTAKLAKEVVIDRRGREPKEVETGRTYVEAADIDILPGCLTSCIRTGRAVELGTEPKKTEPKKTRAAKVAA